MNFIPVVRGALTGEQRTEDLLEDAMNALRQVRVSTYIDKHMKIETMMIFNVETHRDGVELKNMHIEILKKNTTCFECEKEEHWLKYRLDCTQEIKDKAVHSPHRN